MASEPPSDFDIDSHLPDFMKVAWQELSKEEWMRRFEVVFSALVQPDKIKDSQPVLGSWEFSRGESPEFMALTTAAIYNEENHSQGDRGGLPMPSLDELRQRLTETFRAERISVGELDSGVLQVIRVGRMHAFREIIAWIRPDDAIETYLKTAELE